ncbi:phosphatidylserine decarboxylase [Halobacillus halophilus]|uniref:phosphatidylserine decarboxylase n=1 Tax=Halobacillus halophilus (strain ATCC 35676 / DSM 2266 / JCM 20832 / KCTC 3685 / LMG 17431 / NBRC 102448 / NCIMB 2269) TaxID=866895 RepID=I0JL42_HALH3|nr:archaetidylserine decarboxylase [Halobacillus halophilus]ASF38985.1 phosphatidylserine decarboxylase [Halobacillus halophilus]CCG44862.1 phosphatidylserine decarboxylase [Halobacillus halophilus DSM 2266]
MKKHLYRSIISFFNSQWVGKFIQRASRFPLSRWLILPFVKVLKVQTDELDKNIEEFTSLEDFFVRKLRSGARPVKEGKKEIVSPVDAKVEQLGEIKGAAFKIKGISYSINDLLENKEMIERFQNGLFIVLYLSPRDYHRIHSPVDAVVTNQYELGGKSTPVNKWGLALGNSPISTNYRIITELKQDDGMYIALVKVGAMWVNTIQLSHSTSLLKKGEEVGFFNFGSTVVLLFEKGKVSLNEKLKRESFIKAGEPLANKINVKF